MEHIVQQITMDFVKSFMNHFEENGIYDLGKMATDILERTKGLSSQLLEAVIEEADRALVELKKERKEDGISIHERAVPRTIYTAFGQFNFRRTYFKVPSGNAYLLDEIMNLRPYDRVDTHVSARMVNESAEASFGRGANIATDGHLSRQTAWRKAMECGEVVTLPRRRRQTPKSIHIFADEDHVDMQDGTNTILPLITITSGKVPVCKNRNELTDTVHINGYGLTSERRWEYAYAVCAEMFDMDKVQEVYIYGDGASWIATSSVCFPNAIQVLDGYHFRQKMTGLTAGEICSEYGRKLHSAVRYDKMNVFQELIYEMEDAVIAGMPECKMRRGRLHVIREFGAYIINHWDKVQNMSLENSIGSCTEAMVSHVFSERFSRNPMGWSRAGLSKMSMIRVFVKNGEKVSPSDIGVDKRDEDERHIVKARVEKYESLMQTQQVKIFEGVRDWRWFERENVTQISPSGTKVAIDALARMRKTI
jgi:hypothetical protein